MTPDHTNPNVINFIDVQAGRRKTDSKDVEGNLLAALLVHPDRFWRVLGINASDFEHYGREYQAVADEITANPQMNMARLRRVLKALGHNGDPLRDMDENYLHGHVEQFVEEIRQHSLRRRIITKSYEAAAIARDYTRPVTDALSVMIDVQNAQEDHERMLGEVDVVNAMMSGKSKREITPTGLKTLDDAMGGGLYAGYTYGFSGKAKSGKTMLAGTISYNLCQQGVKHLYVALEMGSEQIEQRKIARALGFNSIEFLKQDVDISQYKPKLMTTYLDWPGITWEELQTQLVMAVMTHGIKGFILDYWQLVEGKNPRDTEEKHLRDVAQGIANFCRKHKVWCILLSQTNDDGKTFAGRGLVKACDQLYMIETPEDSDKHRWLHMSATRYTLKTDVGNAMNPAFRLNERVGPHFEDIG